MNDFLHRRGGTNAEEELKKMSVDCDSGLTGEVIGAAIAVHRALGPDLNERTYEEALSRKLTAAGLAHQCQKPLPLLYKDTALDCGFRMDVLVDGRLPIELKAVEFILPIHFAQLLTYLRLSELPLGLLINFDVALLKHGIKRAVLTEPERQASASPVEARDGFDPLSAEILHAAAEVHRMLGPGLMRSAYEECLCHELRLRGIGFVREQRIPVYFEGHELAERASIPLLVANEVPVYCLSVPDLTDLHESTLLARLRQAERPHGFLLNFNTPKLSDGIRRMNL